MTGINRSGGGAGGTMPITVTGGDTVGSVKTARINGGLGGIQWARYNASTGAYASDITGQTGTTYPVVTGDVGFIVGAYLTSYQPFSHGTTAAYSNSYARFQASMAAVAAGTGYSRVGLLGDSTTAGARALGGAAAALRTESPTVYLKTALGSAQSQPVVATSWIADQSFFNTNAYSPFAVDTRFSAPDGAGFGPTSASPLTVAGSMMFNSTNNNRLGFLPELAVDTFDVYYAVNTTLGSFNLNRTGATQVPVSQVGASGIAKVTMVTPLDGANPIYASRSSGGAYVIGMDTYNSAIKSFRLLGLGWSGGKVADWITNVTGFDPLPSAVFLNLDLVIIRPGINDAVAGTAAATFQTQLLTLVDALIAGGTNVALATQYPSNVASASLANQDALAQVVRNVATLRGLKIRDTYAIWGSWVAANALGDMADNLHPNKQGYTKEAVATASFMLTL